MAKKSKPKGGKAKPKPSKKSAKQESVRPSEVLRMTATNDFLNLHRRCKSLATQGNEINGSRRELIGAAVETKYLNAPAFSKYCGYEKMSPQKFLTEWACLQHYIEIGGLVKKAEEQMQMQFARQEIGEKEEGHPAQRKKKNGAKASDKDPEPDPQEPAPVLPVGDNNSVTEAAQTTH